ncbi:dihydrodipicolinate synthase family protein [Ferrimicrobium acidiphilum]|uniref:4-hydroxy-tetrahydrodipicolinate synthase n=1 Tax=Ferrimicrobium acidiphilum DSM 19497 TaxID=1121877 RepID=A0A0D8FVR2_9ACTN|nr:dihydrodipicolinate synthase family protein [Ferrimicrobium acidiphilum]KJE77044.1 4-hydroxy-tetrahydrodipicolinate synthase [Ferrimicrobium acidiphilum DSM 19497]
MESTPPATLGVMDSHEQTRPTTPSSLFEGIGVALVTLFDEHGDLLAEATAEHAARLVDLGVNGVLVAGSTGEASALTDDERVELVRQVRAALPAHIPVFVGTGQPSARAAVITSMRAVDNGADALLVLSPPRSSDSRPYYEAIAAACPSTPILAYHFPAVSSPGIEVDTLCSLPVAGCKDSSGDAARLLDEVQRFHGALYVGNPVLLALAGILAIQGAILAVANLDPALCHRAIKGDAEAQIAVAGLQQLTAAGFPRVIKQELHKRFGTATGARLG